MSKRVIIITILHTILYYFIYLRDFEQRKFPIFYFVGGLSMISFAVETRCNRYEQG